MKKLILGLVMGTLVLSVNASSSQACSVTPVNPTVQKNDLAAHALTQIGVSIENVSNVDVADYVGSYIWTPMCPKGLQSKGVFTVAFDNVNDPLTRGCTAVVAVEKIHLYENGPEYKFDLIQTPTCLE